MFFFIYCPILSIVIDCQAGFLYKHLMDKFSIFDMNNYFSISGDSKRKKNSTNKKWFHICLKEGGVYDFVVRTTQNNHFF